MKPEYLRLNFRSLLGHVVEECGEVIQAAGKIQRWGLFSVNPELEPEDQLQNVAWLEQELLDLKGAIQRLEDHMGYFDREVLDKELWEKPE